MCSPNGAAERSSGCSRSRCRSRSHRHHREPWTADAGALRAQNRAMRRSCAADRELSFVARAGRGAAGRAARGRSTGGSDRPRRGRPRDERVIDIIVPRGGASLIEQVQQRRAASRSSLSKASATPISTAPPTRRRHARGHPQRQDAARLGRGATETLLVDQAAAMLPPILADLKKAGCELRERPRGARSGR